MTKIKDIAKVDRPRERLLKKGTNALSKTDLLAILLGSGIKGTNVQTLAKIIITKFNQDFLNITIDNLLTIKGIGQAKALQIYSAIALIKRFYEEKNNTDLIINNVQNVLTLTFDIRDKKKEHLICLHLDSRNALIKKETLSIGLLDKSLIHPREIFSSALENKAANVILIHNHPSGDPTPSKQDEKIAKKISEAGKIMGIPLLDFIIIAKRGHNSFYQKLKNDNSLDYVSDGFQMGLFDLLEHDKSTYESDDNQVIELDYYLPKIKNNYYQLQNRRYIGGKQKLISWIFSVIKQECKGDIFTDIFAGTGIVSAVATKQFKKVILNDFLFSNNIIYQAFFGNKGFDQEKINNIIKNYNNIDHTNLSENYFSKSFGGKYFSQNSAKIIGFIRENIEQNKSNLTNKEYCILIASLLYSIDRIANTVGHYDAYFKKKSVEDIFFMKSIEPLETNDVSIFKEDANILVKNIVTDIAYIDPPYNSRQYSRFYHVLENLTQWKKPKLHGVTLKLEPKNMRSSYKVKTKYKLVNDIDTIFQDIKLFFISLGQLWQYKYSQI